MEGNQRSRSTGSYQFVFLTYQILPTVLCKQCLCFGKHPEVSPNLNSRTKLSKSVINFYVFFFQGSAQLIFVLFVIFLSIILISESKLGIV